MDSCKYFGLSYKAIWCESMDSCKIPLGESKWILALGCEFLTLSFNIRDVLELRRHRVRL